MAQEIERKFMVEDDSYKSMASSSSRIVQGYICRTGGRTVRVRIRGEKGFLTIKGPSMDGGISRFEWEHEIPVEEAYELMELCQEGRINKTRYLVPYEGHLFEVDEFYDENQGLVIAEVELTSADESFVTPPFLGQEVTGDRRYYNANLTVNPYNNWNSE